MSHFCMWAVTKSDDDDELERIMQPYHEFECTGIHDEYVVHTDETKYAIEKFNGYKDDYKTVSDFLKSWFGCNNISKESENFDESTAEGNYGIVSDDDTKIIKYVAYTNPNSKWDWWEVGGRWSDSKDFVTQKKNINIDKMIEEYKLDLTETYTEVKAIFDKYPEHRMWRDILAECNDNYDKAREIYNTQPAAKELSRYWLTESEMQLIKNSTVEEYIVAKLKTYAPCFGVVTEDGWYESGEMGWFATVRNEDENWYDTFMNLWNSIPDDYYIWTVDCHI